MAPRKPVIVDFDLDALDKEANSTEPFTFRIHGHVLTLDIGENSDFRVLDALAKGDLSDAIHMLLGDAQYAKFTEKTVSVRKVKSLLNAWYDHKGTSTGE